MQVNRAHPNKPALPGAASDTTAVTTAPATESAEGETDAAVVESGGEKERGVIRNILDGHYKGVAAVRLRINFADELGAIEEENRSAAIPALSGGLTSNVDKAFASLLESSELGEEDLAKVTELKSGFDESIKGILAGGLSSTDASQAITKAATDFVGALSSFFAKPPSTPEAVETAEETETNTETETLPSGPTANETAFTAFSGTVTASLGEFSSALESETVLPEIPPPSGKGVAFNKFLGILQSLQPSGAEAPALAETVA